MKTIVTGGAGFIGSHLTERLLRDGDSVTVIDNFVTGRSSSLLAVEKSPRLRVIREDIRHMNSSFDLFSGADCVFHLAALADIVPSIQNPVNYYETNVTGTLRVLEAARRGGVKRFVYVASSSCYGIPSLLPTPEKAEIQPQYPYALTKHLGELTALHWGRVYKMPVVSLRLFNVYGPRHRTTGAYGAVFGVFLAQKLAKKPLTIVGDGKQTRDFTHVFDVVEALVKAAQSSVDGEIFNVGSGGTYPVNLLADLIGGERVYIPKRPGEPDSTFADIKKIQKVLLWSPKIKFQEGVSDMLQKINEYQDAPVWTPETIAEQTRDWFRYLS